jgi:hypothetical protein
MTATTKNPQASDPASDLLGYAFGVILAAMVVLIALPALIPLIAVRATGDAVATKARFWVVWRWQWIANTIGVLLVAALLAVEATLLTGWVSSGDAETFFATDDWGADLLPMLGPSVIANLLSGGLLLPVVWSWRRRRSPPSSAGGRSRTWSGRSGSRTPANAPPTSPPPTASASP